jgi:transcriptional regulator with XRE-family HTH domain
MTLDPDAVGARALQILIEERKRQGLSMRQLAAAAGLSQPMISYLESGMRAPSLDTFLRLCGVLEIKPSEVLKRAE